MYSRNHSHFLLPFKNSSNSWSIQPFSELRQLLLYAWHNTALLLLFIIIIIIDSSRLKRIQVKLAAICYSRHVTGTRHNRYNDVLVRLDLPTLRSLRRFPDALFLISAFKNKISCLYILDIVSLHASSRPLREFSTFTFVITLRSVPKPDFFFIFIVCILFHKYN
jgi:hypothetical protein